MFKTVMEPFRIHSVEPIRMTTREERIASLEVAGYSLFRLNSKTSRSTCSPTPGPARCRATSGPASSAATRATRGSPSFYRFEAA